MIKNISIVDSERILFMKNKLIINYAIILKIKKIKNRSIIYLFDKKNSLWLFITVLLKLKHVLFFS